MTLIRNNKFVKPDKIEPIDQDQLVMNKSVKKACNENSASYAAGEVMLIKQQVVNTFAYFLNGEITNSTRYNDLKAILRAMSQNDHLHLHINCCGGDLYTALELINAIKASQGNVVAVLDPYAASAASMIFLQCPCTSFNTYSTMMIHAYTDCIYGKANELKSNFYFNSEYLKNLYYDIYENFLTKKEIDEVLAGKDMYFNSDQINRRLKIRNEKNEKENKKNENNSEELNQDTIENNTDSNQQNNEQESL